LDTGSVQIRQVHSMNLRAQIEKEVRDAILRGVFKPGERLVEYAIANQLGVSRAPLREVLSALEREGLVVNIPRRGNFVIDFTEKDIDEIYSLRLLLEIGALRRAITRIKEADFQKMQELVNQLGESTQKQNDLLTTMHIDLAFHEYIYELADHNRMLAIWNGIRTQTQLLIVLTSKTHSYNDQPMKLHQEILNALRARNLAIAEATLTAHILDAQQRAVQALSLNHAARREQNQLDDKGLTPEDFSEPT
jgi:DNA-binding GntR family transcriptional regulator